MDHMKAFEALILKVVAKGWKICDFQAHRTVMVRRAHGRAFFCCVRFPAKVSHK